MEKEPSADHLSGKTPTDDLVKDRDRANPADPLPTTNPPDEPARKVEDDAQIEDRFEATDN